MATAALAPRYTEADIRHRLLVRQILVFGGITLATCTANIFTALSNFARDGIQLQWWEPTLWEYSSAVMILALIPVIAWLYQRAPITAQTWRWAVPLHLAITPVFSLIHVGGMVLLRKLGYVLMHAHYDFGAWWPDWFYEYRKDFVTYALILGGLQAFRTYRLWLESQVAAPSMSRDANARSHRAGSAGTRTARTPGGEEAQPRIHPQCLRHRPHRRGRQLRRHPCPGANLAAARIPGHPGTQAGFETLCTGPP